MTRRAIVITCLAAITAAGVVRAQEDVLGDVPVFLPAGMEAAPDEGAAWTEAQAGRFIKARELADGALRRDSSSYVAHFVLGFVYHYGEANAPRALFHTERALALYQAKWGREPEPLAPWRWHAKIIQELAAVHGELEHYEEQLRFMALYNESYRPHLMAEMAWPLMKLRRFDAARQAARAAQATGEPRQLEIALNALCAIEFEAGDDRASYDACRAAMELHGGSPERQSAVDFTNFAEAARSVFRLDEAERVGLLAARAQTSWYGNPHVELAELYIREGRFIEALASLREVPRYRARRPPHVQESDRNESRRALAEFFLVVGRAEDAMRITEQAVLAPDRRGHNSRDPRQDEAIAALLDRRARLMHADALMVEVLGAPFYERIWAWVSACKLRFDAWSSGRRAARALADDARLVGTFMIGTSRSAVLPPWLAGELVQVLGPGIAAEALTRARAEDRRAGASPYYDAFEAEAAHRSDDFGSARALSLRALEGLAPAETLLRARMHAIAADSARVLGDLPRAVESYDQAFQTDPGVFVRMELEVPARISTRGGTIGRATGELIASSPRFVSEDVGLRIEIEDSVQRGQACLIGASGSILACAEEERRSAESDDDFARRLSSSFHRAAFAPRIDLSQTDANGLDGANVVSRDPLRTLFGVSGDDTDVEVVPDE